MPNPPIALDVKYYAKLESTFDTNVSFVATDGVDLLDLQLLPEQEFMRSKEHTGTASLRDEIKGRSRGKWTAVSYFKPQAAGTAPDIGPILEAALSATPAVSANTSVTYAFHASNIKTLQLGRTDGSTYYEVANGAVVESVQIDATGPEAKITFSGSFASIGFVYAGLVTNDDISVGNVSDTTFTVAEEYADLISVGAMIKIGSEHASNAGFRVTAYDRTNRIVTFDPATSVNQAAGVSVIPFVPSPTVGGTIIGGIGYKFSLDGGSTSLGLVEAKININTGFRLLERNVTSTKPHHAVRGQRDITIEATAYYLAENANWVGAGAKGLHRGLSGGDANFYLRIGEDTAGQRVEVKAPKCRVHVTPLTIPEAEEIMVTINMTPRINSSSDDEMTIVWK